MALKQQPDAEVHQIARPHVFDDHEDHFRCQQHGPQPNRSQEAVTEQAGAHAGRRNDPGFPSLGNGTGHHQHHILTGGDDQHQRGDNEQP